MKLAKAKAWDAVVVGGGIMGCGTAWELARRGLRVVVLEKSVPGAEASSAAAGILGAQVESHADGPAFELALASRSRYPRWAEALAEATAIDIEYRACGVVRVHRERSGLQKDAREVAFQRRRGATIEVWDRRALNANLPALSAELAGALSFPDDARVDPRRLLRALRIAAERAGAHFQSGALVRSVAIERDRCRGVTLDDGSQVSGGHVIVAAGSWSSLVAGVPLPAGGVAPARGQIIELSLETPLFQGAVFGPDCYLVARDDGRLLIGSTLEFVGYRREVTAGAMRNLLDAAIRLVPALASAVFSNAWSSFRPYTQDALPLLGSSQIEGLLLSTGHYRNGILLAPISAEIIGALVLGTELPVAITAFSPSRRRKRATRRRG